MTTLEMIALQAFIWTIVTTTLVVFLAVAISTQSVAGCTLLLGLIFIHSAWSVKEIREAINTMRKR